MVGTFLTHFKKCSHSDQMAFDVVRKISFYLLVGFYLFAGINHFLDPDFYYPLIPPYFKFPDWVLENQARAVKPKTSARFKKKSEMIDLNQATAQELRKISGVGQKLSARIVKFRDRLGGFLVNEQLYEVYGLEPEVAERVLRKFQVIALPKIQKININTATWEELSQLVYITENTAKRIVAYRNENGPLDSLDELGLVKGFPKDKITRIGLYLSLSNDE